MFRLSVLLICLWILAPLAEATDTDVKLAVELMTPDQVASVIVDQENFMPWVKPVTDRVETFLRTLSGDRQVVMLISVHADQPLSVHVGARPALGKEELAKLKALIKEGDTPRTRLSRFDFLLVATIGGGCCADNTPLTPPLPHPREIRQQAFAGLDLGGKMQSLRDWVAGEVIPVLAWHQTRVDAKYVGVQAMGKILEGAAYQKQPLHKLIEDNDNFWRAMMEMVPGDQGVLLAELCMRIMNGEIDKARRLLMLVEVFSEEDTVSSYYARELRWRMGSLYEGIAAQVEAGIKLHDAGNYAAAKKHYHELQKAIPGSAWLAYELYLVGSMDPATRDDARFGWDVGRREVYGRDPMYPLEIRASNAREAHAMFLRMNLNELFRSADKLAEDLVRYADTALDLGNHAFAARLYWLILSHLPKEAYKDRNILAHYLYCLDKIGNTFVIGNFAGDFPAEFAKIEAERQRLMEESDAYRAFRKK